MLGLQKSFSPHHHLHNLSLPRQHSKALNVILVIQFKIETIQTTVFLPILLQARQTFPGFQAAPTFKVLGRDF